MKKLIMEVDKLAKTFENNDVKTLALRDATFNVEEGDFLAIMGPSGSGKSTLLHTIGLLLEPSKGKYKLFGKNVTSYSEDELAKIRNKKFGFVFQSFYLMTKNTVYENVKLPLLYSDIPEKDWDKKITSAIENVGLGHRINHLANQLSGGEKQRVAIARALVTDPKIIFADEPTGNLDLKSGKLVMDTLRELNENHGYTILLITHEATTAKYAQRMIYFEDGEIVKRAEIGGLDTFDIKLK